MNKNGEMLVEFLKDMDMENLNETLTEGRMTWCATNQESAFDYMLVNGRMCENVSRVWVDEDGMIDIVSDDNMLVVECRLYSKRETRAKSKKEKWRLKDVGWENFQVDLSERNWEDDSLYNIDDLNANIFRKCEECCSSPNRICEN